MASVPVAAAACLKSVLHPDGVRKGPIPDRLENMGASVPGKARKHHVKHHITEHLANQNVSEFKLCAFLM